MSRPSVDFLKYLLGLRGAESTVSTAERSLLCAMAAGQTCIVEVGVYEGLTSRALADAMGEGGLLWLVDPYFRHTRPERLFGISFSETIARRVLRSSSHRVRFLRMTSVEAANHVEWSARVGLVFIDGDHSYEAVRDDFMAWLPNLAPGGVIAFHDSRQCAARPELLASTGPVRLVNEILRGEHGRWNLVAEADSVAVVRLT